MSTWPSREATVSEAGVGAGDLFALYYTSGWQVYRAAMSIRVDRDFIAGPQAVAPLTPGASMWPEIGPGLPSGPVNPATGTAGATPDLLRNGQEVDNRPLFINNSVDEIWQVFTGIDQPQTYVYQEIPQGDKQGQWNNEQGLPGIQPGAGGFVSTYGWQWAGWESLYGDERAASMFFYPPLTDVNSVSMAVFNWSSQPRTPRMKFVRIGIKVVPLDPRVVNDARLIDDVLRNRIRAIKWSPGVNGMKYKAGPANVFQVPTVIQLGSEIRIGSATGPVMAVA